MLNINEMTTTFNMHLPIGLVILKKSEKNYHKRWAFLGSDKSLLVKDLSESYMWEHI